MAVSRRSTIALVFTLALLALSFLLAPLVGTSDARSYSAEELAFLQLINEYRAERGAPGLVLSDNLSNAAARHSRDMGTYSFFSHTTAQSDFFPAGSSSWDRMRLSGYTSGASGENIAAGTSSAQQVFDAWRNSTGHDRNMLDPSFRAIGIGRRVVAGSPYNVYWTTDFGSTVDALATSGNSTGPFTDVDPSDAELWNAAEYVLAQGYFEGYRSGALGCWQKMTRRHVALVLERADLGSRSSWMDDYRAATRGEVMQAFPGLDWHDGRTGEPILRSQLVRLLYRAR